MGYRIKVGFYEKMYDRIARPKKVAVIVLEVAVRRGSTVLDFKDFPVEFLPKNAV